MHNKTVCVVGLGYIGLPTAALLASSGYQVHGVDLNQHAVNTKRRGPLRGRDAVAIRVHREDHVVRRVAVRVLVDQPERAERLAQRLAIGGVGDKARQPRRVRS